jgi:hypothetical protein
MKHGRRESPAEMRGFFMSFSKKYSIGNYYTRACLIEEKWGTELFSYML